jgi:hypothetical protein
VLCKLHGALFQEYCTMLLLLLPCCRRILGPTLEELKQLQLEQTGADEAAAATAAAAAAAAGGSSTAALAEQQQPPQQQQQAACCGSPNMAISEACGAADVVVDSFSSAATAAAAAGEGSVTGSSLSTLSLEAAAAQGAAMSPAFAPLSAAHVAYRQRLDEQERRSARINTLLRKDFLHRMLFTGYVYGKGWLYTASSALQLIRPLSLVTMLSKAVA